MIISTRPIQHAEVEKLVGNYLNNKKPHLDKGRKDDDNGNEDKGESTSVWFDNAFIEVLRKDLERTEINGLRIYFGAYDKKHQDDDKKNKMTVVLVTTTGSGVNAVDAIDERTPDEPKAPFIEYNDGKLCPPMCQTG